ncbi:hypothetical protein J0X14_06230 [Muricauda sp. CAU 1633]|uniref:hypothetical protein n=1 Tax=Allomuricauda sp. CAU 1633 TaxID=2816036 RepID=UPI001A8D099E|nr:hypothetical protein [Muricauda sp. CAU 1633]MBO0321885.1 hypothetical protein [Muricauda sp. CAU 1633]
MKNLKKVTATLLGGILLVLVSCQQGPKKEEPIESKAAVEQERVEPPKGIISLEESKSLYDNYTRNRLEIIQEYEAQRSPEKEFEAARFTSFSYADIKQYMDYIEQESKDAQVDISSLRFYFANYPDKEDFPDGKKIVHPRQNSIFIVPTMETPDGEYGFYIGEDGKAKLIKNAVGETAVGNASKNGNRSYASFAPSFATPTLQQGKSLNMNQGGSGPPPWGDF